MEIIGCNLGEVTGAEGVCVSARSSQCGLVMFTPAQASHVACRGTYRHARTRPAFNDCFELILACSFCAAVVPVPGRSSCKSTQNMWPPPTTKPTHVRRAPASRMPIPWNPKHGPLEAKESVKDQAKREGNGPQCSELLSPHSTRCGLPSQPCPAMVITCALSPKSSASLRGSLVALVLLQAAGWDYPGWPLRPRSL